MGEAALDAVRAGMRGLRAPGAYDAVHKDECAFSFHTPFSMAAGLLLNLHTLRAVSEEFLAADHQRTGHSLYLRMQYTKVAIEPAEGEATEVTKLAIGTEGGFQVEPKYDITQVHTLVVMPDMLEIPLPCAELPELVIQVVDAVIKHAGALHQADVAAWQEEALVVSKYAQGLQQLDNGKKISPNPQEWKCEESGMTENLWLNLSTGHIGSGRKNWDGTGGTGAALNHYEATGRQYPLCVKLGTITPQGADVFSYAPDENDLVQDPLLSEHLSHWGIDVMKMEKTEKSMAELNVELNKTFEFDKITEAGANLAPLTGPGYMGLKNLGNSCYMNSVMQVLVTIPEVQQRYVAGAAAIFASPGGAEPEAAFDVQMAKLAVGLCTDKHCAAPAADGEKSPSVEPRMFKNLVGKGHAEFATGRQQDAREYLDHLMEVMSRAERAAAGSGGGASAAASVPALFKFQMEERIQCGESNMVRYKTSPGELVLGLDIPMDAATNLADIAKAEEQESKRRRLVSEGTEEYIGGGEAEARDGGAVVSVKAAAGEVEAEPVRPIVPFDACVARLAASETIEFRNGSASKTVRFKTFPPYLVVQMQRFFIAADWTMKKRDVLVPAPDVLDLEPLRAQGLQPGEVLLPEDAPVAAVAAAAAPRPDEAIVAQLMSMGFSENGSKRAALATNNADADTAMTWVFAHMEDADFNSPLPDPAAADAVPMEVEAAVAVDPESVATLASMGFATAHVEAALKATSGNLERAADWLFSHAEDIDAAVAQVNAPAAAAGVGAAAGADGGGGGPATSCVDGAGRYELFGIVSHMGSNTACGHYVCHIKKEGRWVLYNDEKVAESQQPPKDLGYLYFYRRAAA